MRDNRQPESHMPLKPQGRIFNDITETIGGTPLVRINRLIPKDQATVLAKCEFFNPLSSVKDRIGVAMIEAAEAGREDRQGDRHRRADQRQHGHRARVRLRGQGLQADPHDARESMSIERRRLLKALGAQVVLTPAADGMRGSINKAEEILERAQEELHAAAVREPGQPRDPPPHDGRGDLAGHRRQGRHSRRRASARAGRSPAWPR